MLMRTVPSWGICISLLSAGLAIAQDPSVADAARNARKDKPAATAPRKVYDNDSLPKGSTINVVGESTKPAGRTEETSADTNSSRAPQKQGLVATPSEIAAQKNLIADLEADLNQFKRNHRLLEAENTSEKANRSPVCGPSYIGGSEGGSGVCRDLDTEVKLKYNEYKLQVASKEAILEAARKELAQMLAEVRDSEDGSDPRAYWTRKISEQKRHIADLESELVSVEQEFKHEQSECAWKNCAVLPGMLAEGSRERERDQQYLATKAKVERKQAELADARRQLDILLSQAKKDGVTAQ